MSMTWEECKSKIQSLGFVEDSEMVEDEYPTIIINSVNRALDYIYNDLVKPYEAYFSSLYSTWGYKVNQYNGVTEYVKTNVWTADAPEHVSAETEEDYELDLPDNVVFMVPLLASHWIWLDDEEQKAYTYYNEYVAWRNDFIANISNRNGKVIMTGGLWF